MKKKILILNGWFLPGFKGGGPVQSCNNLIQNLHDEFDFYVLTSDRDLKDKEPYKNVKINEWNKLYNANVYYLSPDKQNFKGIKEIINSIDFDAMYLNNYFNFKFTITPLLLKKFHKIKNIRTILAVRGDFTAGCETKKIKKYTFIFVSKILGIYNNILWHATNENEKKDILKKFPKANIVVIPNLKEKYVEKKLSIIKKENELKLVFISRIAPIKNIKYALNVLNSIKSGKVIFDIYGPIEDEKYWNDCKDVINGLPSNVTVNYKGELQHDQIASTYQKYHVCFYTTLGENFGHAIVEAMMNNCICLISKGVTPWDGYIYKLHLGSELNNKDGFINDINKLLKMNQKEFEGLVKLNNDFIKNNNDDKIEIDKYNILFSEKK